MRAYLIDPVAKEVTEHDVASDDVAHLEDIYHLGQYRTFGCVLPPEFPDVLYVDDEGMMKDEPSFFSFLGYPYPIAGRALVQGVTSGGDSRDPASAIDDVRGRIAWWR